MRQQLLCVAIMHSKGSSMMWMQLASLMFICMPEAPLDSICFYPLQPSSSQPLAVVKLIRLSIDENEGGVRPWVWVALQSGTPVLGLTL